MSLTVAELFLCAEDAATAYNFAVYDMHGPFAYFNVAQQTWLEE